MKSMVVLAFAAVVVVSMMQVAAKYPAKGCTDPGIPGFYANLKEPPNACEEGYYTYCYKGPNGKWTMYPYRCGKSPKDPTIQQVYVKDKGCIDPSDPTDPKHAVECP